MDTDVSIQLQAMQLNTAREALGRAQTQKAAEQSQPGPQIAPAAVLDLSAAAQALLSK